METIRLGGTDKTSERLYLREDSFEYEGKHVIAKPTDILPKKEMKRLITRHKGRYHLCGLFLRYKDKFLDFPCGSGYASQIFHYFNIDYLGFDVCKYTIAYARRNYSNQNTKFGVASLWDSLCSPLIQNFNVIACIEGIEHIREGYQEIAIKSFYNALKPNGVLIISSPEPTSKKSGPNPLNPHHKHELTLRGFLDLLNKCPWKLIQCISIKEVLHTGELTTCLYGICHK